MAATVEFTTANATAKTYSEFITKIRDQVSDEKVSHGIRVMPNPSDLNDKHKFLLVKLTNVDSEFSITLALTVFDATVIGYAYDENTDHGRSFFLRDAPPTSLTLLFPNTKCEILNNVSSGSGDGLRSEICLGIEPLKKAINVLHEFKDATNVTDVFRHNLVVLQQMVSQAVRFVSIENYISNQLLDVYKPSYDTISYEDNWSLLSEQIQAAPPSGKFPTPVDLLNLDHSKKTVTNVTEVKRDIALIIYKST